MFCRNKKNSMLNRIFKLAIIIISFACLSSGCTKSYKESKEFNQYNEYIVNNRSKKIHSADCQYVSRIKETNKQMVKMKKIELY